MAQPLLNYVSVSWFPKAIRRDCKIYSECGLQVDFGQGISVTGLELINSRRIQANIYIDRSANIGYRDVTVITDAGSYTRKRAFRVR